MIPYTTNVSLMQGTPAPVLATMGLKAAEDAAMGRKKKRKHKRR